MKCCGQERNTPYCPRCGNNLQATPVRQLLNHVWFVAKNYRRQEKELKIWAENHPDKDRSKRIGICERAANKWESWEKALRELIEKAKDQ